MADGGHKDEYIFPDPINDDLDWWAETRYNIRDVRSLWSSIDYYQSIWPGPPERQENEKAFLEGVKRNLYRMITDYNYSHHHVEDPIDTPNGDDT